MSDQPAGHFAEVDREALRAGHRLAVGRGAPPVVGDPLDDGGPLLRPQRLPFVHRRRRRRLRRRGGAAPRGARRCARGEAPLALPLVVAVAEPLSSLPQAASAITVNPTANAPKSCALRRDMFSPSFPRPLHRTFVLQRKSIAPDVGSAAAKPVDERVGPLAAVVVLEERRRPARRSRTAGAGRRARLPTMRTPPASGSSTSNDHVGAGSPRARCTGCQTRSQE